MSKAYSMDLSERVAAGHDAGRAPRGGPQVLDQPGVDPAADPATPRRDDLAPRTGGHYPRIYC